MRCVIVSHTHWDREWYRSFQAFRARLVDTVDRILELLDEDPGYHFQLDGQSIVLEDYLEIRPHKRADLERACASGRVGIGPWYVQPDSLLPSGEAHVRNLLEGRRVASEIGPCSTLAYTPDSFGHPAQFPQLFAGFGLSPFVYWRGNGNEIASLPSDYRWVGPDGTKLTAVHLPSGYFAAWGLGADPAAASKRLSALARRLAKTSSGDCVLLMNGIDHMLPDPNTETVAQALSNDTGWQVERGLLDAYAQQLPHDLPEFRGELIGGRIANLLPGVWSTRTHQKLRNRSCETSLEGQAEPWVALLHALGGPDESPSLRTAWRSLLPNQAHDSLCGCSQDRVHEQMEARYDACEELAEETTRRALERIAGLGVERQFPDPSKLEIAVFNPSPHPRTEVVRLPLEGYPAFTSRGVHPLLAANLNAIGFEVGGAPARLVEYTGTRRPRLSPDNPVSDLEFIARDVPAFGWLRLPLETSEAVPDRRDAGREIRAGDISVRVSEDGTFEVEFGAQRFSGLASFEDLGDRGDSYDFDPVLPEHAQMAGPAEVERIRHASGIAELHVRRVLRVPAELGSDRRTRSERTVELPVQFVARVVPGVARVDLTVTVDNAARDHRLRLCFPTGVATSTFQAATTFDTANRTVERPDDSEWIHPAPPTFPHQGWIHANGLSVVAAGLPEAEVDDAGSICVTLLRAVGWLSRPDLETRPGEAGPALPTPGAQCAGSFEANLSLFAGLDPAAAQASERKLWAVGAGDTPLCAPGQPLVELEPREALLSALKPAEDGDGLIVRLLNPTDRALSAQLRIGFPVLDAMGASLDEMPSSVAVGLNGGAISLELPPHALRSLRVRRDA